MFASRPVAKLSRTRNRALRSSRASTRCEPMKPAPPVTSTGRPSRLGIGIARREPPSPGRREKRPDCRNRRRRKRARREWRRETPCAPSNRRLRRVLLSIPGHRPAKAIGKRGLGPPTEGEPGAARLKLAPRLTVGAGRIPDDLAAEVRFPRDESREIADGNLLTGTEIDGLRRIVPLGRQEDRLGGVFDVQKLARRRAVAPEHHLPFSPLARLEKLPNHRRNDVTRFEIKIVPRAVQVDRKQVDSVESVLLAISLQLHEEHFLGEPVRSVRLLRVSIPDVVFAKWDGRVPWIGANRAEADELLDAGLSRFLDELDAHDRILVEELPGMRTVRTNASHDCSRVDDEIWPMVFQQAHDSFPVSQIVRRAVGHEDLCRFSRAQPLHEEAAQEALAARDDDALTGPETHEPFPPSVPPGPPRPDPHRSSGRSALRK